MIAHRTRCNVPPLMAEQVRPARPRPITALTSRGRFQRLARARVDSIMARSPTRSTQEAEDTTAVATSLAILTGHAACGYRFDPHRAPRPPSAPRHQPRSKITDRRALRLTEESRYGLLDAHLAHAIHSRGCWRYDLADPVGSLRESRNVRQHRIFSRGQPATSGTTTSCPRCNSGSNRIHQPPGPPGPPAGRSNAPQRSLPIPEAARAANPGVALHTVHRRGSRQPCSQAPSAGRRTSHGARVVPWPDV